MRIRTLLSLSHALVIGIFIVTFLAIFFTLTEPPGPPPGRDFAKPLADAIRSSTSDEELGRLVQQLCHGKLQRLDVFDLQGNVRHIFGPEQKIKTPSVVDEILEEDYSFLEEPDNRGIHVYWFPMDLTGSRSHAARLQFQKPLDAFFQKVRKNILASCSIAFLAVFLVALLLSKNLSDPIRRLAALVDRFGREGFGLRSQIKGTAELEELSHSFNRMAEYIEQNTNALKAQKEEAERIEASRRQFLSDVSHNLRTPLAAIMGWNDAILEGVADDEAVYRQRIRREVTNVTKTVQRLLELSRWERAKPVLLKEDLPLSDLLLEVAETLQDVAEQAEISLAFEGLSPTHTIHADRQKARDVFQILLENVVEHAGRGVEAVISVEAQEEWLNFKIEDNGKGFPPTFQGSADVERGASEVGRACLGLAICSRLVSVHGGRLELANGEEKGAVARFSFPRGQDLTRTLEK